MTKKITPEEVQKIASLAHLTVEDSETEKFSEQLSAIVEYIAVLETIPTESLATDTDIIGSTNRCREDTIVDTQHLTQEEALQNAPEQAEGEGRAKREGKKFKVKAIL